MIRKNTTKLFFALFCLLILRGGIQAQEAVFAQYYYSPMHTNPAMTGVFKGQYRFNANYRQQWSSTFADKAIKTVQTAFDYRIRVVDEDYFSFGINALNDETGSNARIKTTRGNLGLGYLKQLGGSRYSGVSQYISAGAQVGLGQHFGNLDGVWFDRQFDSVAVAVNNSFSSGEIIPQSNMYTDFNLGLMFYSVWDEKRSFYAGVALHHLTQPNISFFGDKKEALRRRITFQTGGEIPFGKELSVLPSAMFTIQGPSMTSSFGGQLRYANLEWDDDVAIRIGMQGRIANRILTSLTKEGKSIQGGTGVLADALTLTGTIELNNLLIGASYDMHTSSIRLPTNTRGAWELSLIYTGKERRRVKTECPRF
jgi:type IX secretion system PorP/SprF family membrane protein